jgi:hypothetical protein
MRPIIYIILLGALLPACTGNKANPEQQPTAPLVGADQDEHGCKASAGYQWSSLKNECIRIFESGIQLDPKAADLDPSTSAFVVFKSDTDDAQAEVYLPGEPTSRLFAKAPDNGAGTWKNGNLTLSQWKGMYTLQDDKKQTLYEGAAAH